MKITGRSILCTLILGVCGMCATAQPLTWHVSPAGNDEWSGRQAEPAADGTDGPLATLAAAVAAAREHADTPRRIVLSAGRHYVEQTLTLDPRDSQLTIEGAGAGETIVHGGRRVTDWRPDGDNFWTADVPEAREGTWDFRALVVNDRLCPRARLPETGRFTHETHFPVRWMSTAGGGWERPPTERERTTMQYRDGDLGPWLSVRNAEITVYHMWDESMVGLADHDPASRTLTFSAPAGHPPGAFGRRTYVVWNVREGMTQPGQWYLDRDEGRIVYWPLPDEDMEQALVVAPSVESIVRLGGREDEPIRDVTVRSLTLSTTTTPCEAGGFGASRYRGAVDFHRTAAISILDVEITNTAGHAIREWAATDLVIRNCRLHHLGAGGLRVGGGTGTIEGNHIHDVGMMYPSAIALAAGGGTYAIRRNVIHDTTYSGMAISGTDTVIEENLLYRCMTELHDGAAIYVSGANRNIIRRNVVRDVQPVGEGYGVSAYYLDEKCRDTVVEGNVSIGVARPSHNHMTLNCTLRDNVFIVDGDMNLSFSRSANHRITGNTFHLNGNLNIVDPDAVVEWEGNLIVQSGEVTPTISDAFPVPPRTPRETPVYANALAMLAPPTLDGKHAGDEWPPGGIGLRELPDQRQARGAPVAAKLCTDGANLHVGIATVAMFPEDRRLGNEWGMDEGVEVTVQGARADGEPVVYVLRGYADGAFESLPLAGASEQEAQALAQAVQYAADVDRTVWRCEWVIPLQALRFTPADRAVLPMNVTVYRSEDDQFVQWAGTLGETHDLERGGRLVFREERAEAAPRPKPAARAAHVPGPPEDDRWPDPALTMQETPGRLPIAGRPCTAHVATDGEALFVRISIPIAGADAITGGTQWTEDDGAEICIRGWTDDGRAVTWILHGFPDGTMRGSTEAGAPEAAVQALAEAAQFDATVGETEWVAQWRVPLDPLGISPGAQGVPFNLGVLRTRPHEWVNWVGTLGPTWRVEEAGLLHLEAPGQ